jgi:signal transduction histidine kinase
MRRQQALLEGKDETQRHEMELIRKDGTRAIIEAVPSLITENGHPVGFQSMMRDVTEQKKLLENMQFYISEITSAQEDERKRISRELHDETAQSLATLLLDIEALDRAKGQSSDEEKQVIKKLRIKINTIVEGVRSFAHELRPPVLDQIGLVPALELLVQELNEGRKIKGSIEIIGSEYRISANAELAMFRIAQEALRNVRKHSQATEVTVKIEFAKDTVSLTITDNGRGFELPQVIGNFAETGKLGLIGMQERARLFGGSLSVESQVGRGTTVSVEIASNQSC